MMKKSLLAFLTLLQSSCGGEILGMLDFYQFIFAIDLISVDFLRPVSLNIIYCFGHSFDILISSSSFDPSPLGRGDTVS